MDFRESETQRLIASTVRDFAEKEVKPIADDIEETMHFPVELLPRLAELGLMGIQVPEEYGGAGLDTLSYVTAIEELARVSASVAIIVSVHNSLVLYPFLKFGNDEQKRKYIPDMVRGRKLGAYCITESTAGSDVSGESSLGVREG
ncbi:MAG: acyl-CoA dehydrogenase family protein, partial [Methanomassiliicoccales archaeon]